MRPSSLLLLLAVIALLTACTSDPLAPTATDPQSDQNLQLLEQKEAEAASRVADHENTILNHPNYQESTTRRTPPVYLSAGSVDGLQAAIDHAGPWGKVVVKAGLRIENQTVNITHPVRVVGEEGAIIQSNVAPTGDLSSLPGATITPLIYIDGADFVRIRNLTFVPDPVRGFGELAIGTNHADYVYIRENDFQDFTCAVLTRKSEYALVSRNQAAGVLSAGLAQNTILGVASAGFIHASGAFGAYVRNSTSNFIHGLFLCDRNGLMWRNTSTGNFTSLTLCKWPKLYTLYPNGDSAGADISATQWLVIGNKADQSISNGFQVFDGSNSNLLISNEATNSGDYDVYFAPDVAPGPLGIIPLLPAVFDNTYIGGFYPGQLVKDCGINTTIFGANVVDLTVDPCP